VNIDRQRLIDRVKHFYARLSAGDRLGEAFYAVWMAVVSIGLIKRRRADHTRRRPSTL
jgi:hypothetical protein